MDVIELIKNIGLLIAVLYAVWQIPTVQSWFNRASWWSVEKMISKIYSDMSKSGFVPEIIIGVGRGGAIASSLLSNRFESKVIPVVVLSINHQTEKEELFDYCTVKSNLSKVLVITATVKRWDTTNTILKKLEGLGAKEIKTGCLVLDNDATKDPDYYGKKKPTRQIFPWMRHPTIFFGNHI